VEKDWELKGNERRRNVVTLPNAYASPDEFEAWREEAGIEEGK